MDWSTFFKDNSQSIFTLGGVFLGSLITFLISYLNNRFDAKERDKDRGEKRKEAKIELALELMRSDIKTVDESIDKTLMLIQHLQNIVWGLTGELSGIEIREKILKEFSSVDGRPSQLAEESMIADKLAYALGEDFHSAYDSFNNLSSEYMEMYTYYNSESYSPEYVKELYERVTNSAAKLHNLMNEKLISLRDT